MKMSEIFTYRPFVQVLVPLGKLINLWQAQSSHHYLPVDAQLLVEFCLVLKEFHDIVDPRCSLGAHIQ